MASIRSRGNRTTELAFASLLRKAGITGWRRHLALPGRPDFAFTRCHLAVFIDGCFWHGCARCRNIPVSNREFWSSKISANKKRDRRVTRLLEKSGWQVIRFWEHELRRQPTKCRTTIRNALQAGTAHSTGTPMKSAQADSRQLAPTLTTPG